MERVLYPQFPVLLVDDEQQFLQSGSFSLRSSGISNILQCNDSREVLSVLAESPCSAIVLDILMPHVTGRELLPKITQQLPNVPVIMLTAINEVDSAVECMRNGAFDYLVKPVDKPRLVTSVKRAVEYSEIKRENDSLREHLLNNRLDTPGAFEGIVTRNQSMHSIFQYIEAVAQTVLPILITAETGAGKEMVARSVHRASGRKGEFVPVNVAGLDDNLFSDTLFGHEKGAFTGADKKRVGLIGKAEGGTIFLDEIGDLALESQVKLLRLLEERTYYPIGSDVALPTDARVVVATNADLDASQREGKFRSDLFYRLRNHHVHVPPLRERKDDIPLLTDFFLEQGAGELGKSAPTPPPELYTLLGTYHYPGNVRELRGMVYDAVSRHKGGVLSTEPFRDRIQQSSGSASSGGNSVPPELFFPEPLPTLKETEQSLVEEALKRASNNQTIAAQMLGLTRSALNKRLNRPAK